MILLILGLPRKTYDVSFFLSLVCWFIYIATYCAILTVRIPLGLIAIRLNLQHIIDTTQKDAMNLPGKKKPNLI